ncbi:MAG: M48 family metallopeptidase, partial [Verrucomicrobiales bacterium]
FQWLDGLARGFGQGPIVTGLIFVAAMVVAGQILSLPFNLYDTFVIEEKYGFNKTTGKTYATDFVKNLFLSAALGLPIFSLLLYLFQNPSFGNIAWLVAWIATTIFQLIILFIYPKWILPLFNEFKPLEDQELKDGIETMAKKCDFPLTGIFEMDGSKRSTKSNAYFAGFGKHKKIALFDTLIKKHSVPELVAVLAHEIGHFKKKHILKTLILGILQMGVIFYLLGLFLNNRSLFDAFGVQETSVYLSFIFFSFLLSPLSKLIGVGMAIFSRKNEFEADAFAVDVTGSATPLITALKSLSEDNLSNLTPHPFYVFINYSHPPMTERLAALRALA